MNCTGTQRYGDGLRVKTKHSQEKSCRSFFHVVCFYFQTYFYSVIHDPFHKQRREQGFAQREHRTGCNATGCAATVSSARDTVQRVAQTNEGFVLGTEMKPR